MRLSLDSCQGISPSGNHGFSYSCPITSRSDFLIDTIGCGDSLLGGRPRHLTGRHVRPRYGCGLTCYDLFRLCKGLPKCRLLCLHGSVDVRLSPDAWRCPIRVWRYLSLHGTLVFSHADHTALRFLQPTCLRACEKRKRHPNSPPNHGLRSSQGKT